MNDWKAKELARAAAAAALAAANPGLVTVKQEGDSLRAAAKNMRIELGRAFPGVKFSVKSRRFSGGDAIDVSWTDGPTSKQVDEIIDRYSGGSFDGMQDLYTYSRDAWTDAFGDAKYVHSRREMSDAAIARAIRLLRSKFGDEKVGADVTVEAYRSGALRSRPVLLGGFGCYDLSDEIAQAAYRQCYALTKPYRAAVPMADEETAA